MGMTNKQFYGMIGVLIAIIAYSGIVFWVAEEYGRIWGVISLNIVNVCFFLYIMFVSKRITNEW